MRIVSWNVNGLRACARKGFLDFLESSDADVVCLQEVRITNNSMIKCERRWLARGVRACRTQRLQWRGDLLTATADANRKCIGVAEYDVEGRYLLAHFGRTAVASVYFPKGSGKDRDNSRVGYKLGFYSKVFDRIQQLKKRGPVVPVITIPPMKPLTWLAPRPT